MRGGSEWQEASRGRIARRTVIGPIRRSLPAIRAPAPRFAQPRPPPFRRGGAARKTNWQAFQGVRIGYHGCLDSARLQQACVVCVRPLPCVAWRHPLIAATFLVYALHLTGIFGATGARREEDFMANVVVVGSQWGDEGKGKIVDWLSEQADIVVRFQGGHNAGHTLVIDGVTFKLSLLPSGVVRPNKLSVIGNGVVLDPRALIEEIGRLKSQGVEVTPDSLRIAENVTLILPLHQELDVFRESSNASTPIGTTRRGIGPAYEDKVGRRAIRVMDLDDLSVLGDKIDRLLAHHNTLRRGMNLPELEPKATYDARAAVAPRVLPFMDSVWSLLDRKWRDGKRILFEGAQGALLDVDHGTYPYVTSSNTVASQAATGSGL